MTVTTSRMAKCGPTCPVVPSTPDLFGRTTAEQWAKDRCLICHYALCAHAPSVRDKPHMRRWMGDGHDFVQTPLDTRDYDTYYCGCRGWD